MEAEIRAEIARMEARIESRTESRFAALEAAREAGEIALATIRAETGPEIRAGIMAEIGAEVRDIRAEIGAEREMVIAGLGPLREIAERLAGLHAGDEALARTFAARITALEEQIAALDPGAALESLADRLEAARILQAEARDEADRARDAEIRETLGSFAERLDTGLDTGLETGRAAQAETEARLGARLDALEARPVTNPVANPEEAILAEARAAALALVDEQTALFANRLALLEASLPSPAGVHARARISDPVSGPISGLAGEEIAEGAMDETAPEELAAEKMAAGEMAAGEMGGPDLAGAPEPEAARDADLAAIRNMRRIVSLHRK